MSRVGETETAYAGRDAPFLVTAEASWTDPSQSDEAIAWGREVWGAMERHSTGGVYLNFPGLGEDQEALVRAGYGVNYERLAALKAKYDPTNLFRMNINITPACGGGACSGACFSGFSDCNANKLTDGCEISIATDSHSANL